jgi:hypothetical protein
MKLNEIQNTILQWLSKNIEATDRIRRSVLDELDRPVSDVEISAALLGLHAVGYLKSYVYDHQTDEYVVIISPDEYSMDALYWLAANEAG